MSHRFFWSFRRGEGRAGFFGAASSAALRGVESPRSQLDPVDTMVATKDRVNEKRYLERVKRMIEEFRVEHKLTSIGVAVSINGQILMKEGLGCSDLENGVPFAHDHAQCETGGVSKLFTAHCYAMCKQQQQRNSATERPLLDAKDFRSYLSRSDKQFPHPYLRDRHIVIDDYQVHKSNDPKFKEPKKVCAPTDSKYEAEKMEDAKVAFYIREGMEIPVQWLLCNRSGLRDWSDAEKWRMKSVSPHQSLEMAFANPRRFDEGQLSRRHPSWLFRNPDKAHSDEHKLLGLFPAFPGYAYLPSNLGFDLAGLVMEQSTERNFAEILTEETARLDLNETVLYSSDEERFDGVKGLRDQPNGLMGSAQNFVPSHRIPSDGVSSSIGDLLKFSQIYLAMHQRQVYKPFNETEFRNLLSCHAIKSYSSEDRGVFEPLEAVQSTFKTSQSGLAWEMMSKKLQHNINTFMFGSGSAATPSDHSAIVMNCTTEECQHDPTRDRLSYIQASRPELSFDPRAPNAAFLYRDSSDGKWRPTDQIREDLERADLIREHEQLCEELEEIELNHDPLRTQLDGDRQRLLVERALHDNLKSRRRVRELKESDRRVERLRQVLENREQIREDRDAREEELRERLRALDRVDLTSPPYYDHHDDTRTREGFSPWTTPKARCHAEEAKEANDCEGRETASWSKARGSRSTTAVTNKGSCHRLILTEPEVDLLDDEPSTFRQEWRFDGEEEKDNNSGRCSDGSLSHVFTPHPRMEVVHVTEPGRGLADPAVLGCKGISVVLFTTHRGIDLFPLFNKITILSRSFFSEDGLLGSSAPLRPPSLPNLPFQFDECGKEDMEKEDELEEMDL